MGSLKKIFTILVISVATLAIAFFCINDSPLNYLGYGIALTPFLLIAFVIILVKPFYAYITMFLVNYFIIGVNRYLEFITPGIIFDGCIILTFVALLIKTIRAKVNWNDGINLASILALIWVIYCIFELFNPEAISSQLWFSTVRGVAFYFFLIIVLTCIICNNYKSFKKILSIWGVLVILALSKALMQKFYGFDQGEKLWLYRDGGYSTHIIATGIRYFSFFSDAACFGSSMGQAMVVFSGSLFFVKKMKNKVFFAIVALAGFYSLLLSGTRSAFIIPLVGFTLFILLSKNKRIIFLFSIALIAIIGFFRFTTWGSGNAIIRRVRSVFYPTQDASLIVRLNNQKLLRAYMYDKPFGAGIGHGGVKAKEGTNNSYLSQIPTDSWYVMIWVETGIIGLILHLLSWIIILAYCTYIVLFKLKNMELRGYMAALLSGITGILVASYATEIFGMPTGVITYASVAFIILSPKYEKELQLQS